MKLLAPLALLILTLPAAAQQTKPTVIAKVDGWTVAKMTDAMTDQTSCFAMLNKHPAVTLTRDRLTVSMKGRGGIGAFQFRFDKEKASDMAAPLPSDGNESWWFGDTDRIKSANQLQVRIEPLIGRTTDFDIDLRPASKLFTLLEGDACK